MNLGKACNMPPYHGDDKEVTARSLGQKHMLVYGLSDNRDNFFEVTASGLHKTAYSCILQLHRDLLAARKIYQYGISYIFMITITYDPYVCPPNDEFTIK